MSGQMSGSVTVGLDLVINNYKEALDLIKKATEGLDLGSVIGKQIKAGLEEGTKRLNKLETKNNSRVTSNLGLEKIRDEARAVQEIIQRLSELTQQVTGQDIKLDIANLPELKGVAEEIKSIQEAMSTAKTDAFNEMFQSGTEEAKNLKTVMEDLRINFSELNAINVGEVLQEGLESAEAAAKNAREQVAQLNQEIANLDQQKGSLEGFDKLIGKTKSRTGSYNDRISKQSNVDTNFVNAIMEKIHSANIEFNQAGQEGATEYLKGFSHKIRTEHGGQIDDYLISGFVKQMRSYGLSSKDANLFGRDLPDIFSQVSAFADPAKSQAGMLSVMQDFESAWKNSNVLFSDDLTQKLNNLFNGLDASNVESRFRAFNDALAAVREETKRQLDGIASDTEERKAKIAGLNTVADNALQQSDNIKQAQSTNAQIEARITALITKYDTEIARLREQIEVYKAQALAATKAAGGKAGDYGRAGYAAVNAEIGEMQNRLEQVKAQEQALGKFQGLVQRWFSIYTVVRMVRQGLQSIKKTLQELDKTITNIAIVTDKGQDELWGQMQSYINMARQYGVAISGVYEVSQLFYQQGLQQNDVMALTEQTLKMARISGLEYADATNYEHKCYVA